VKTKSVLPKTKVNPAPSFKTQPILTGCRVKICGITNLSDALAAQNSNADAIGFVFYPQSRRYIRPAQAKKIIACLDKSIKKVGVFVDAEMDGIKRIAGLCGLDMLQFHGRETPGFCRKFKGYKIIKAFRIKNKNSLRNISRYRSADYYLFDTFKKGLAGGTGEIFEWRLIKDADIDRPFFLSGGLNLANVEAVIAHLHPAWVDVSSGVEIKPGKKSRRLIREFIQRVKKYER